MEQESLVPRIGKAIRTRRKDARLTLTQVAQRAEISVSHLSNIENGLSIASLPLLAKVAAALNISLAELTRDENRLVARAATLPDAADGWRELSHAALETEIMAGSFDNGSTLAFPLPLAGRDCFVTLLRGSAIVTVDGVQHALDRGDAIDARSAVDVTLLITEDAQIVCSTSPSSRH
ncbi:helix-turn-helix transcriptional regulator [uncultured Agrococcus sp.]|uniref:helix-turn-helix domain-containing protein n=1 Tax=uncultured Agrococcus sp. TaxID=382258 RepID=UPI0025E99482|nr:helix-turn-helix transcriptional regulator [uncultured Agrococcus sp.]